MKATVPFVEKKFDEFNQQMFGGKLPRIPVVLSNAKTFLGQCAFKRRRTPDGKTEKYDFKLRINTRLDLPETEVEDIIIHEMIHYYIGVNQLEDTSVHGKLFRQLMDGINRRWNRHVSITHRSTKEQHEQLVNGRRSYHVIAVVTFHDGRTGIKVLPRVLRSILYYYNNVSASIDIKSVELYMSNNTFFNHYPNSKSLKVYHLDAEVIRQQLADAEKMGCDGRSIVRNL